MSIIGVFATFYLSSCSPKDDKSPRIFFDGDVETSQEWVLQEKYSLPKAKATDNVDGDISDKIVISNDLLFYETREDSIAGQTVYTLKNKAKGATEGFVGKTGDYTITYSVSDEAGNSGKKSINVKVKNSLDDWCYNGVGDKIQYLVKRIYKGTNQQHIGGYYYYGSGGVYEYYDEYDKVVNGKEIYVTFTPDKYYNYRIKLSKVGNISGLSLKLDINRYTTKVDFQNLDILAKEDDGTQTNTTQEYYYQITQINAQQGGVNEYDPETKTITITYQITRYTETSDPDFHDIEYKGRYWNEEKQSKYQEVYYKK